MPISLFVLALYVFLQSAVGLHWFYIDPALIAFVGMVFVVIVLVEAVFAYRNRV